MRHVTVLFVGLVFSACGKKVASVPDAAVMAEDAAVKAEDAAAKVEDAAPKAEDVAAKADEAGAKVDEIAAPGAMIPVTSKSPEAIAAFEEGRELAYNFRMSEALVRFDKALTLDPDFLLAQVYRGYALPGTAGVAPMGKAVSAAAGLPEAERLHMEAMFATRRGDDKKADELDKKVAELASGDWRAHMRVGLRAFTADDMPRATAAFDAAVALNPKIGALHNLLGYSYFAQGKKDEAIESFKKYVELAPDEPNPHDSLADALIGANRLAEAEAEYGKAAATVDFAIAWQGVAAARALQGNWAGAREALTKGIESGPRAYDKNELRHQLAWLMVAEGKLDEGLEAFAKMAVEVKDDDIWFSAATFDRAFLLFDAGRIDDADKVVGDALGTIEAMPAGLSKDNATRSALVLQIGIAAKRGKTADVDKHLDALDAALTNVTNANAQSRAAFARGLALMDTDALSAAEIFKTCIAEASVCKWYEVLALDKGGHTAAAAAKRQEIRDTPYRYMEYVWVHGKVGKN